MIDSRQISLSGQLSVDDIKTLAEQGVKSIVNNRPDHEAPDQPTSEQIAAACQAHNIAYQHIAFAGGAMEMAHVEAFADFFNHSQRPLHMFCRTGNRSNALLQKAIELDLLDA